MFNGITINNTNRSHFQWILRRYGWDGVIKPSIAKQLLDPTFGIQNIHHRNPISQNGALTLRDASLLDIEFEHIPWHCIFGSRDHFQTVSVEHNIHKQLGSKERTALRDIRSESWMYVPELVVDVSSRVIDQYLKLRDGRSQKDWLSYINSKFNDPFFPWVSIENPFPVTGFSRIQQQAKLPKAA